MPLETVYSTYPVCSPGNSNLTVDSQVIVKVNYNGNPEQSDTALDIGFPMAIWIALVIHAVGIELYLRLTPKEAERLRNVSYKRQLAAGMQNPGSAGLVAEKFGDMDLWEPQLRHREDSSETVRMEDETK